MLSIFIPTSQFEEGGRFAGKVPSKIQTIVPLAHNINKYIKVTSSPTSLEDWEFQPLSNHAYHDILEMVRSGLIEIERDGVTQTPADLISLFRENYQEL